MKKVVLNCFVLYSLVHTSFLNAAASSTTESTDDCLCGIKPSSRIVGGSDAGINEYPWMVVVCISSTCTYESQFCGATLITEKYILTAAHCVTDMSASDLSVSVGDHDISSESETSNRVYKIESIIVHEEYNPGTMENDIALLKVVGEVEFSDDVMPACLPKSQNGYANETATVTGWGYTSYGGTSPEILKEVHVLVHYNIVCENSYGEEFLYGMLCAGNEDKDSCQGDSGGPLVYQNDENQYEVIGVVSWGYGCASEGFPGVYTNVSVYIVWIFDKIGTNSQCQA